MIPVAELCAPLAGDDPCGEDLSLGTSLIELDTLAAGKPETQFSPAEDADWNEVRNACLGLLNRSRDLRVAVPLTAALLMTEGLPGLRDGLAVLRGLVEQQWEGVYPRLDPEDKNDPLQRMNILAGLAAPVGSAGDPLRMVERLRLLPIASSPQIGRFAYGTILEARAASAAGTPLPEGIDLSQIEAALRDTNPAELKATFAAAGEAAGQLQALAAAVLARVSSVQAPSFGELEQAIAGVQELVGPYVGAPAPAGGQAPGAGGNESTGGRISGRISSRDDVLRVLEQIRAFYAASEPGSPIPLLIRRIERLVPMSFLEIMQDIAPDSLNQVNTIIGPQQ
jgi:type VI secretion system protein ImpA